MPPIPPANQDLANYLEKSGGAVDPSVNLLVHQFGLMRQQMFDQFHQTMMMMFEGFRARRRERTSSIREEFDEVRQLSEEIEALRIETAQTGRGDQGQDRRAAEARRPTAIPHFYNQSARTPSVGQAPGEPIEEGESHAPDSRGRHPRPALPRAHDSAGRAAKPFDGKKIARRDVEPVLTLNSGLPGRPSRGKRTKSRDKGWPVLERRWFGLATRTVICVGQGQPRAFWAGWQL